jgi:hypothetical protein
MCKECNVTQTTYTDSKRANHRRLKKLLENPNHIVKMWHPTKWCPKCEKDEPKASFRKNARKRPDGRTYYDFRAFCKACESSKQTSAYRTCLTARSKKLIQGVKSRCKKNNFDFDLDSEWLEVILKVGVCQVTGLPFEFEVDATNNGYRSFTPSLDRTDPTKGYTKDNVKVVVWIYNGAKGVGTHEDVMKLVEALSCQ